MLFNSLQFLWFFLVVYALYLVLDYRRQNAMLWIASLVFYGSWDVRFLSLILISTVLDYVCGLRIAEHTEPRNRKRWLALSVIGNLGVLGFFKYFDFFTTSMADLLSALGFQVNPWSLNIILPVGISFYTFQTMSYSIDIYRGHMKPTRNFLNFALFVAYFPQLVAGPIERARNLLPRLEKPRTLNVQQIKDGLFLIAWGLFKKVIIADHCAIIVNSVLAPGTNPSGVDSLLAMYAFAFQLYGDFSGYSDIARGLSKMMGIELMVNFRLPYFAVRPSDFWGRWHISLTSWVRDYLFVTIGANKMGTVRTHINLIFTMTMIGLWHGARWTFVLWGFLFGVVQAVHAMIQPWLMKHLSFENRTLDKAVTYASMALMFHVFVFSGFLFRAESLAHTGELMRGILFHFQVTDRSLLLASWTVFLALPLWVMQIAQYRASDLMIFQKSSTAVRLAGYLWGFAWIAFIYLFNATIRGGEDFIYFQF